MYEFDLKTFVRIIVKSKKWIIINCCIAMGLAIVVAFFTPCRPRWMPTSWRC